MSFKENNIVDIYIDDSEFDEENVGTISVLYNDGKKIGVRISTYENGTAEILLDSDEVNCLISALKIASKIIKCYNINFQESSRINIITLSIIDVNFNKNNDGIILVNTFNNESIGICISLTKGADPELWMDINNAESIITALEDAVKNNV
jgi:hypothetical protein